MEAAFGAVEHLEGLVWSFVVNAADLTRIHCMGVQEKAGLANHIVIISFLLFDFSFSFQRSVRLAISLSVGYTLILANRSALRAFGGKLSGYNTCFSTVLSFNAMGKVKESYVLYRGLGFESIVCHGSVKIFVAMNLQPTQSTASKSSFNLPKSLKFSLIRG